MRHVRPVGRIIVWKQRTLRCVCVDFDGVDSVGVHFGCVDFGVVDFLGVVVDCVDFVVVDLVVVGFVGVDFGWC